MAKCKQSVEFLCHKSHAYVLFFLSFLSLPVCINCGLLTANRSNNSFCLVQYLSQISAVLGTLQTTDSLSISWKSHPSEVLPEPSPLLESVAGRKYHYLHTFHCRSGKLFRILKLHISRSSDWSRCVWLLRLTIFRPPM